MNHLIGALCSLVLLGSTCPAFPEQKATPIKVGGIFSLSGWAAVGGQAELNATLLAAEGINSSGGIAGRPLEIVYEDNQSDLARTVTAYRKLISADKVAALLGPNWAEFAEVAAPLAEQDRVPMLTASGFSWTLTKNRSYVFTTLQNFDDQVAPLAEFLVKQPHKRIAILHSANTYFDGISEGLKHGIEARGGKVALAVTLNPKESDMRSLILKLQRKKLMLQYYSCRKGEICPLSSARYERCDLARRCMPETSPTMRYL